MSIIMSASDLWGEVARPIMCFGQSFFNFFFFINSLKLKVCKLQLEQTDEGACRQKNTTGPTTLVIKDSMEREGKQ